MLTKHKIMNTSATSAAFEKAFGAASPGKKRIYRAIVIGAGASGLFFASSTDLTSTDPHTGAAGGLILEHTSSPGSKLLISGGGRCNFTHAGSMKDFPGHYNNGAAVRSVLYKHGNTKFTEFMEGLGVPSVTEGDGRIFPESRSSAAVLDALLKRSAANGFSIRTGTEVTAIRPPEGPGMPWEVHTTPAGIRTSGAGKDRNVFLCKSLVIATGGITYPSTGSDGSLIPVLQRDLGIRFTGLAPSLMPLAITDDPYRSLAGVSLDNVIITVEEKSGRRIHQTSGPVLFTEKGLSGPAALNASAHLRPEAVISLSFTPGSNKEQVMKRLQEELKGRPQELNTTAAAAARLFGLPKSLTRILAERSCSSRGASSPKSMAALLTADHLSIDQETLSFSGKSSSGMCTRGGIDLDQINSKTMEFKDAPGLFAIGEVLDVDGETGGYNLQFAFSSARAASECVAGDVSH